jgi:hypothetical protein
MSELSTLEMLLLLVVLASIVIMDITLTRRFISVGSLKVRLGLVLYFVNFLALLHAAFTVGVSWQHHIANATVIFFYLAFMPSNKMGGGNHKRTRSA